MVWIFPVLQSIFVVPSYIIELWMVLVPYSSPFLVSYSSFQVGMFPPQIPIVFLVTCSSSFQFQQFLWLGSQELLFLFPIVSQSWFPVVSSAWFSTILLFGSLQLPSLGSLQLFSLGSLQFLSLC